MTNRTSKKMSQSNEAFQEKWNQKQIDASLIANARIEWIQTVRKITADLLAQYFAMLSTTERDAIERAYSISLEKTELLILFFGHEDQDTYYSKQREPI